MTSIIKLFCIATSCLMLQKPSINGVAMTANVDSSQLMVEYYSFSRNVKRTYFLDSNNKITGIERCFTRRGSLTSSCEYKDGSKHGVHIFYFRKNRDALIVSKIEQYSQGKKHGQFTEFYINSKLKSIYNYKNDTLEGVWLEYYLNGNIKNSGEFQNGLLVKYITYDKNGSVTGSKF
jgi:antitoxin component YwqK of YwqJK toxin-antitoxin module